MSNYTKDLEKQHEQLLQRLAQVEKENEELKTLRVNLTPGWWEEVLPMYVGKRSSKNSDYTFSNGIVTFAVVRYDKEYKGWAVDSNMSGGTMAIAESYKTLKLAQKAVEDDYQESIRRANEKPFVCK